MTSSFSSIFNPASTEQINLCRKPETRPHWETERWLRCDGYLPGDQQTPKAASLYYAKRTQQTATETLEDRSPASDEIQATEADFRIEQNFPAVDGRTPLQIESSEKTLHEA